ncbi:TNF receptor-associated factor 4-like [Dysidea avara]|uniref:TNF receptor-associated factor 4-like n=1 Tax=Dysidea avara TaxID=196820 RepID=UPI0033271FF2
MTVTTYSNVGGYDHKFIDTPPDRLICKVCHFPSRDPYLSVCCGQVFCKSCLDGARRANNSCPFCRDKEFVTFPNKQADREIRSLHVMCANKERGCEWQGELNDIYNHLGNSDGCQFEDVKCSNECGEMLQRQYLTSHVETQCPHRIVRCKLCHILGQHFFIKKKHMEQCPKLHITCPNKCGIGKLLREDMEAHRKDCPFDMVQCEYHNVGCEVRMMCKSKRSHDEENMEEHLLMTKLKLAKTEDKLVKNEERLNALEIVVNQLSNKVDSDRTIAPGHSSFHLSAASTMACPVTVKMSHFLKYKRNCSDWCSAPFYSSTKGYKMILCVCPAGDSEYIGTHLTVALGYMKGPYDDELPWPLRENFEVKLLNQINNYEHYLDFPTVSFNDSNPDDASYGNRIVDHEKSVRGIRITDFISNEDLHMVTPTCQYLKNDCIFFQVSKL